MNWKEIFTKDMSIKGLLSKIYKELKIQLKKINNHVTSGEMVQINMSPKERCPNGK